MKRTLLSSIILPAFIVVMSVLPNRLAAQDAAREPVEAQSELRVPGHTAGIGNSAALRTSDVPKVPSVVETGQQQTHLNRTAGLQIEPVGFTDSLVAQTSASGQARVTLRQVPVRASLESSKVSARDSTRSRERDAERTAGQPVTRLDKRPDKIQMMMGSAGQLERARGKKDGGLFSLVLNTAARLIFVLALAYVSILVLKLLSSRKGGVVCSGGHLRVLETARLSATNSLHVVSAGGKLLLIGCSSNHTDLLGELENAEPVDTTAPGTGRFAEYLSKYSRGDAGPAQRLAGLLRDCAVGMQRKCAELRRDCEARNRNEA